MISLNFTYKYRILLIFIYFILIVGELWKFLTQLSKQYYPIYRMWTFSEAYVHICHPDDIEVIRKKIGYRQFLKYNILKNI